jgi:hypothetical protein
MQTFLPYPDFCQTAKCLDYKRLGKQRIEAFQILEIICGKESRWKNHPAVLMWKGYEKSLIYYGLSICDEWIERKYKDTMLNKFLNYRDKFLGINQDYFPWWFGSKKFHRSHQSNLVRKFPEHYKQFFPDIPDNMPYYWPIRKNNG